MSSKCWKKLGKEREKNTNKILMTTKKEEFLCSEIDRRKKYCRCLRRVVQALIIYMITVLWKRQIASTLCSQRTLFFNPWFDFTTRFFLIFSRSCCYYLSYYMSVCMLRCVTKKSNLTCHSQIKTIVGIIVIVSDDNCPKTMRGIRQTYTL